MHRMARWVLAGLVMLPFSTAQADEERGGDVVIPPPRTSTPAPAPVAAAPPAFVELETTSMAAGIGISWGEGVLSYEGIQHGFSVRGISLLDVGASVAEGLGEVYNLENLADFEGTYVAIEAAGAAGIGGSAAIMRNEHGVEIELRSELRGLELALAPQSFSIAFE